MRINMYGLIVVLFRFPMLINVGLGPWLVPVMQLSAGTRSVLWTGFEPFKFLLGCSRNTNFPRFMFAFTIARVIATPRNSGREDQPAS